MPFDVKSLALAAGLLFAGAEAAQAWERAPAPIEFATRGDLSAREAPARVHLAAATSAPTRRAAASLDQPDILYGYGRVSQKASRAPLDLRGTLRLAPTSETLADDAFEDVAPAAAPVADDMVAEAHPFTNEPVATAAAADTPPAHVATGVTFYIQVGAFADPANAERARAALCDVGPVTVDLRPGSAAPLHRVRLGQWASRAEAELARDTIVERGFAGAVVSGGR